jgi:hypothetical protein
MSRIWSSLEGQMRQERRRRYPLSFPSSLPPSRLIYNPNIPTQLAAQSPPSTRLHPNPACSSVSFIYQASSQPSLQLSLLDLPGSIPTQLAAQSSRSTRLHPNSACGSVFSIYQAPSQPSLRLSLLHLPSSLPTTAMTTPRTFLYAEQAFIPGYADNLMNGVAYIAILVLCPWFGNHVSIPLLVPAHLFFPNGTSPPANFNIISLDRILINHRKLYDLIHRFFANSWAAPRNAPYTGPGPCARTSHSINTLQNTQGISHLRIPGRDVTTIRVDPSRRATLTIPRNQLISRQDIVDHSRCGDLPDNVMGGFPVEVVPIDRVEPCNSLLNEVFGILENDEQFYILNEAVMQSPVRGVFRRLR